MSPLTAAQQRIVDDLDRSLCVTSGAGCGKTRVLVERYIRHLETDLHLPLERLAAITFTQGAAAEMRDRIRQACRRQVEAARQAGDTRRRDAWLQRYWDVDIAPIDTIHAFCASLLRRYAIEAGLDPNFALLDEAEAAFLAQDVVRRTIEEVLARAQEPAAGAAGDPSAHAAGASRTGSAAARDLLAVLEHFNLQAARDLLMEMVQEKREVLQRVAAPVMARSDEAVLRDLEAAIGRRTLAALRGLLDTPEAREALALLGRTTGKPADRMEEARREVLAQAERLRSARTADIGRAAAEALAAVGLRGGSAKAWASAEELKAVKAAIAQVRDAVKETLEALPAFDAATEQRHLALARAFYRTAHQVIAAYGEAKRRRSALDFEDLQIRARDLLQGEARVLEECRKRFRAVLVDELQDTNLLQFQIVDLLVSGGGAKDEAAAPRPGALFGVGDPKQSIYRFRGAEFEVFQRALGRVGDAGRRLLAESFRLNPGTAALVNHLFPPLMGNLYESIEGRREQTNALVGELVVVQKPPGTAGLTEDGLIQEARALADRLQKIVTGRAVQVQDAGDGRWRPAAYGDVAVLLRRMSHLHLYEEALQRAGVPYHVVAGRGFYKQQEVLDVLHLLRVLNDPSDDLSLAGVLRSPFFAVSDEGLYHLRQMAPRLHQALAAAAGAEHLDAEDRRGLRRAAALLGRWSAAKDRRGLAALVDDVVFESGYAAAAVGRFGGERAYANLRQMVELARRFEQRGLYSLGDYVEYVSEFMARQMRAEQAALSAPGAAAVQLMTIHKAKGLEFPIVAVPDLAYAPHGPAGACYVHPATGVALRMRDEEGDRRTSGALALARLDAAEADAAETGRLLYVALTRARDYLILVSHDGYNRATGSSWLDVLLRGLGADRQAGEQTVRLPTGHAALLDIRPPVAETVSHAVRRVGPRDLFDKGRVAWDRLHERAQRVPPKTVADVIAPTGPIPLEPRPPARITATALALYRRCPALYRWQEVLGAEASVSGCEPAAEAAGEPVRRAPAACADGSPAASAAGSPEMGTVPAASAAGSRAGGESALAWGVMSHRAMELATSASPDAVAAAVEGAVREASVPGGAAREELRRRLAGSVEGFWRSPLGRRVAAARQVRRELPFALALAGTEIHGIIDLLFEGADGRWEVADYKSSAPRPEKADEAAKAYELQLDLYALAAGRWLGRPVERWSIYFLGSGAAVERPSGPADAAQTEADAGQALAGIAAGRFGAAENGRCGCCRLQALCNPGSR